MKFLSDIDLGKVCELKGARLEDANALPATFYSIADNSANDGSRGLICHYDAHVYFLSKTVAGSNNVVWKRLARADEVVSYTAPNRVVITDGSNAPIVSTEWGVSSNNLDLGVSGTKRRIVNLADPINDYDAANKRYVDSMAAGLRDFKDSVVFATVATTGGTFSAVPAQATLTGANIANFDDPGITVTVGMRVLVKDEVVNPEQNGIYEITAVNAYTYDLQRTSDANVTGELSDGTVVFVEKGGDFEKTTWVITDSGTAPVLNTDSITWVLFSQVGGLAAGLGLVMTGDTIDVNPDGVLVQIVADAVTLKGPTAGTNHRVLINATGSSNAVPSWGQIQLDTTSTSYVTGTLQVANGGTGTSAVMANNLLYGNGTGPLGVIPPGSNGVLWANAGTPTFTAQPTLGTGIITKGQVAVRIDPHGVSAGNTGELQFLELAANSTHYVGFKAPDSIPSTRIWTLPSGDGSANYFLKTDGAGVLAFAQVTAAMIGSGAALTKADDTNVTLTLGGTPSTALLAATSITVGWSGQLAVSRGGTGISSVTQYAVALGGASAHAWSNVGTAGQLFIGQSSANPAFTTVSGDITITSGGVTAIGSNKITNAMMRQSAAYSVIGNSTNATANVADISAGSDHQVLRRSSTAIGFGSIDLSQSGAVGSSVLNVANGGTGSNTFSGGGVLYGNGTSAVVSTSGGGANTVLTANGGAPSFSGQPALATGIITNGQNAVQINPFGVPAGNTGEIRFLELAVNSTHYVGFKAPDSIAANKIWVLPAADGSANHFLKTDGSGNLGFTQVTAAMIGSGAALTKTDDTNVTLTLGGAPSTALLTAASITVGWSGQLAVSRGGTGISSVTQYAVAVGGASAHAWTNVGSAGQVLIAQSAASPAFTSISGDATLAANGALTLAATATPTFKKLTLTYGTASGSSDPVLSATQTWNNGTTTFTGVSWSFTTTASNAASLLFNLLAGGSPASVFSIRQDGYTTIASGLTVPSIRITANGANGIIDNTNGVSVLNFTGVASATNSLNVTNAISGNPLQLNVVAGVANNANLQFYPSLTGSTPSAWGAVTWKDNAAASPTLRMTRVWSVALTTGQVDRANNSLTVNGVATSFTIAHEFGTANVNVVFNKISTGEMVMTDWVQTSGQETRQVTVSFKSPPDSGAYRVTIIG